MQIHTILPNTNYNFIDVEPIFFDINKVYQKYIFENNISDKRTLKKLLYHFYIFELCEKVIEYNQYYMYKPVFFRNTTSNTINSQELDVYSKFTRYFPVITYDFEGNFVEFVKHIECKGVVAEIISELTIKKEKINKKPYFFSKIKSFCERNELEFLDKKFFTEIRNRVSMI